MNNRLTVFLTFILILNVVLGLSVTAFASGAEADETLSVESNNSDSESFGADDDLATTDKFIGSAELSFSTENISKTLPVMGFGMLGIFIVIIIIGVVVVALNKLFPPKAGE